MSPSTTQPSPTLDAVLAAIREERAGARTLGVELVGVIGSVARGEARPDSDVDVVFDVIGRPTLFDLGEIVLRLEERLEVPIDLVGRRALSPDRWAWMSRDFVAA